ncbi:hypothetical protein FHX82_006081 [Amycolatopsis bartoniae]|uniref:Uncharacterized protein n=1 Tax=Amycolatopsis bartoniae TaxID=941986 RepID=A0A8H9J1S1_9PSEU|nr:hypothetical protein [Amycolatopsis bartoniae]MBB2938995.1 hypothetical protein [Amycolatopsis bartoniae]TVT04250.1 hypothetical protein FNH07_24220 [Amycolatopsis bartoniae]GHF65701.1 hypothetical protein GCM10017566_44120 [Amycolatopsis bartoniae]
MARDEPSIEDHFWRVVREHDLPDDLVEYGIALARFDLEEPEGRLGPDDPRDPWLLAMKRIQDQLGG